jgi:predicted transcriptional regulator of viral defense system
LDEVRNDIKFILVERIEEALNAAIKPSEKTEKGKPRMDCFFDRNTPPPVTTVEKVLFFLYFTVFFVDFQSGALHNSSYFLRFYVMANITQKYKGLYQVVSQQDGFFTTKQAISAGYETNSHPYHVKTGSWIREHRGIYRYANFPMGDRPDLMLWYLWSRNRGDKPQGIYSHETALSIHALTDLNPSKLHMTVPIKFRRSSQTPDILILHYNDISREETNDAYGVKITSPMRTIIDVITEGNLSKDLLIQAIKEAIAQGAVTKKDMQKGSNENESFNNFMNKNPL